MFRFLHLGFVGFPLYGLNNIKTQHFLLDFTRRGDDTFVLTESGLATMNLKNCGRYLRSPSPSLYNAVQTSLHIARQTYIINQLRELNKIVPESESTYIWQFTCEVRVPSHHVQQWNHNGLQRVSIQQAILRYPKAITSASPFEFQPEINNIV